MPITGKGMRFDNSHIKSIVVFNYNLIEKAIIVFVSVGSQFKLIQSKMYNMCITFNKFVNSNEIALKYGGMASQYRL